MDCPLTGHETVVEDWFSWQFVFADGERYKRKRHLRRKMTRAK